MSRIYPDFAYGEGPRAGCWWDQTCNLASRAPLRGEARCDVAIIGAGFTGLSAALHLAQAGVKAVVLESRHVGWGASGRNGGFCCLGGGMLSDTALDSRVGEAGRREWRQTEVAAVHFTDALITRLGLDVDRHSKGETQLAHRASDYETMKSEVERLHQVYGFEPRLTPQESLQGAGQNAGFHGALTIPVGFALNPRKYVSGLAIGAEAAGAIIHDESPVVSIESQGQGYRLATPRGTLRAEKVVVATNGYSSEDLPPWFAGRYMPTQSSIIVTRPLTRSELETQGWTSTQACYDTRHLLHYFRLMPDNRMLFGVRGGLLATPGSERRAMQRARRDFERMFSTWSHVETPHAWSGLVCIARDRMPFAGEVPGQPGMFAALCYHGNGVAMASYCGALLADLAQDRDPAQGHPAILRRPLRQFELGRFRRAALPLAYAHFALQDR